MVVQTVLMQNALGAVQLQRTHKYKYKEHKNTNARNTHIQHAKNTHMKHTGNTIEQFKIKSPKFSKTAYYCLAGLQKHVEGSKKGAMHDMKTFNCAIVLISLHPIIRFSFTFERIFCHSDDEHVWDICCDSNGA